LLAVQFDKPGSTDALLLNETAEPSAGPGEVLIEFEASTINPADVKIREGSIPPRAGTVPFTLGYDLVGVVVANGPGAHRHAVGTRVVGMSALALTGRGTWSERVCLPESSIARAPEGVSPAVAAQLPLAGLTALQAVQVLAPAPETDILVTGAAGAIGRLAVQLLHRKGQRVHALVRDEVQAAALPSGEVAEVHLGAVPDNVAEGVVDTIGADFSSALRPGGSYVGVVPGCLPSKAAPSMAGKTAKVIVTRESGEGLDALARLVERQELVLPTPAIYSLEKIREAHEEYERRTGRRIAIVR